MTRYIGLILATSCALGCGHSGPSSTSVSGSVANAGFQAPTAVFNREGAIKVLIADDPQLCQHLITQGASRSVVLEPDGTELPSLFLEMSTGHFLGNDLRTEGDDLHASLDPGAANVALRSGALCSIAFDGGPCLPTSLVDAASGTVNLDRADDVGDANAITSGSFDLSFPDGGKLSGTFHATPCNALHSGCGSADAADLAPLALLALCGVALRRRKLAVLALALAGCGSAEVSSTQVSGALPSGAQFSGTQAIYSHQRRGHTQVLVSDDPRACQHLTETELFGQSRLLGPDGGIAPSLFVDLTDGHFLGNDERTVGDDLTATLDPGQPVANELECVHLPDAGFASSADGGPFCTRPVDVRSGRGHLRRNDDPSTSSARAEGDIDLSFPVGSAMVGTFSATPCAALHASGCTSVDGLSLLPLLALLGLRRKHRLA